MSDKDFPTVKVTGANRRLNVRNDPPDIRDRYYEPALIQLQATIDHRDPAMVLDQGQEGACTGFGLAAAINLLNAERDRGDLRASMRMLYEMARKHDEWPGEDYAGSSCRGAIRGWKNMGVCTDGDPKDAAKNPSEWAYKESDTLGGLTVERARAARVNTLGAYYRLRPEISDYHAAINETGAIYVSARVTDGWSALGRKRYSELPVIPVSDKRIGGHAFAIVGYDKDGFIVQNSWGPKWGHEGFGVWTYEDWVENIMDGWTFRLALPTPSIFGHVPRSTLTGGVEGQRRAPKRFEIAGHFVHFDDGKYKKRGDYWSTAEDIENTAKVVAKEYKHLMVYAHGGLNAPPASARRVHALKEGFKRNGIYPFHIMYDTGLVEEIKDTVRRALHLAEQRSEGFLDFIKEKITDVTDTLVEDAVRRPVTAIWDEMKRDAKVPFERGGDGLHTIRTFAKELGGEGKKIHLVGHSTGAVLLGHLLDAFDGLKMANLVSSCSLMAPACTVEFYHRHYHPRLGKPAGKDKDKVVRLPKLAVYCLSDQLELDDNVAYAYRKSLLYLITRALERERDKPVLGMERDRKEVKAGPGLEFIISKGGKTGRSVSTSHGGFDNDPNTLNDIMKGVLGVKKPPHPFTKEEMEGY
ncbi:MAG: C1 family peptidase [Rhodospirillales bacterium]|nr:C1 family peptidase [Rhodospirillales bacterium]MDH3969753.1 C1 family peptidase [Rhodospirillales bacterium]